MAQVRKVQVVLESKLAAIFYEAREAFGFEQDAPFLRYVIKQIIPHYLKLQKRFLFSEDGLGITDNLTRVSEIARDIKPSSQNQQHSVRISETSTKILPHNPDESEITQPESKTLIETQAKPTKMSPAKSALALMRQNL